MIKKIKSLFYAFSILSLLVVLTTNCKKDNNSNDSTIKDVDGNVYHSVTIGSQTWMVENLKVTHYRNGDPIANVTDNDTWKNLSTGAYCDYSNSSNISMTYGRLYNWYAVIDNRILAPVGWHIASDEEWMTLIEGISAGSLKEAGTTHWDSPNEGASNETGFTALPGGQRNSYGFDSFGFHQLQAFGNWWTSSSGSIVWNMSYNTNYVSDEYASANDGNSVRCVKGELLAKKNPIINWLDPADILFGTLLNDSQLNATSDAEGTFIYSPPLGTKLNVGSNQILKVDFIPTNTLNYNSSSKTVHINVIALPIVTDIDGNIYTTVKIGTQEWMVENLKTTRYNDGSSIPLVTDFAAWGNLISPGYCWYNNDVSNKSSYGALYNWFSVNTGKLAPTGWHVPSNAEWTTLTNFLGGENGAGGKLKETGTTHWNAPNTGATNETGFTALPGGWRGDNGNFYNLNANAFLWSSTNYNTTTAWWRILYYDYNMVYPYEDGSYVLGFSVRCIKD